MTKRTVIIMCLFMLAVATYTVLASCGQLLFDVLCTDSHTHPKHSESSVFLSEVYDFPDSVTKAMFNAPADRIISPGSGAEVKSGQCAVEIARRHMLKKYDFTFDNYGIEVKQNEDAWWIRYTTSYDYSVFRADVGVFICRTTGEVFRAFP